MSSAPHGRRRTRRHIVRQHCAQVIDLRAGSRTLHVVDVENLLRGRHRTADVHHIAAVLGEYDRAVGAWSDDLTFYGVNPALHFTVVEATDRGRVVGHGGPDGADAGLLEMVRPDWVVGRFDRLCIGSGDHAFAPLAAAARAAGVHVVVACAPRALSADLYVAAGEHVELGGVLVGAQV